MKKPALADLMPFSTLRGYQRAWVAPDLIAGITLLVIAVPEQLATSRLAGMPPITGFYAFIAGTLLFALLGSNPQMSVGADSTIAPLFAVGLSHLAPLGSDSYVALVSILAVMVGIIVALIGLLRLGWIAEFLSTPIITGFMGGVAVTILVHQLPDFFGLGSVSGSNLHRVGFVITHLGGTNGPTLALGAGVLVIVFAAERINRKLPGALVGLVGSTALVGALGLVAHGVAVVGTVAHGAPHVGLSGLSLSTLGSLAPIAAVVALVVVSQSAATTRSFADQGHYEVDVGRDFVGIGAGSIVAGLFGSFPVDASPARTGAVANAGGRSQAACLGAALAVIAIIPAAGVLKDVPLATLAAVLIFVATRLFKGRDLLSIVRFDRFEFGLAVVTLLTVALVGVEQGIGVAVVLAIADRARITSQPRSHVLGRMAGTTSWTPLSDENPCAQVPSVLVMLFSTPLWYANAEHFKDQVDASLKRVLGPPKLFVLDTIGMNDLDFTGSRVLGEVLDDLARDHITFAIARASAPLRQSLQRSGLMARIGPDHFFPNVDEAVTTLGPQGPADETTAPTPA
jgi:sulfate permease, SulP family